MALRHHQFQQQPHDSSNFRDSPGFGYDSSVSLYDHSQHPPYIPPFHVVGLAPSPVAQTDDPDGAADLLWNYGDEPEPKRKKKQDFLENDSQISFFDFVPALNVSTGLGLSLENTPTASTSCSALFSRVKDYFDAELQRQNAEIDRHLKMQRDKLRASIHDKIQTFRHQTLSFMEENLIQKLYEKEAEIQTIKQKNEELEVRVKQLIAERGAWRHMAEYNENMINVLKYNLEQADSRGEEGFGDSEVDDAESCFDGRTSFINDNVAWKKTMMCKLCRVKDVLLSPCQHLYL